jgi:multimeric flavodoxin WrbA
MKVLGINGSPRAEGNTAFALNEMARELAAAGIEMEIVHIGNKAIRGCLACGTCARKKDERCVMNDDPVNEMVQRIKGADAIVLGSPVHYAGIGGTMKSFCDRAFYVAGVNGGLFDGKVGASIVAVRRSGGSAAWQGLNYYLTISNIAIAGASYWSIVHGALAGEAESDAEGLQTVRNAAKNMAWMLAQKTAATNVPVPQYDCGARTNFIR